MSKWAGGVATMDYLPCVVESEVEWARTQSGESDISLLKAEADIDAGCVVAEEGPSFQVPRSCPSHTYR